MRSLIFPVAVFVAFSIALFGTPLGVAAGATNQTSVQSQTAVSQPWLIEQIIELQTKSAKLEATIQQQHLNNADIKNAEAELHNLQIQLTELKERLSAQGDNQVKELASVSKRVDDVLWLTNTWGFVLSVWGLFAAIGALYLGVKAKDTAIQEAHKAAQEHIKTESKKLIEAEQQRFNTLRAEFETQFAELRNELEIQGKQLRAQTLLDKARDDFEKNPSEATLLAFDALFEHVAGEKAPSLRAFACGALIAKGLRQSRLNRFADEIETYNQLIAYVGDDKSPELAEHVALAMGYKGITQIEVNQFEQAIETYDALIVYVGTDNSLALREQVSNALVNKGVSLDELNQLDQALETYDAVIAYVGEDKAAVLRDAAARGMVNKGLTQYRRNQYLQAIETLESAIAYVGDDRSSSLIEPVAVACNGIGFTLLSQSKQLIQEGNFDRANNLLTQALEKFESAIRGQASGMFIGNKAYTLALLGQQDEAERLYAKAFRVEKFGGEELYQATLKDFDIHPIEQDKAFREIVERQWQLYQAERQGKQ